MTDTRPVLVLRALAAKGPLSTPQIMDALELRTDPPQRALSWLGTILRKQERDGQVREAGRTAGAWQQSPAVIWKITEGGLAELRLIDSLPERRRRAAEEAAELAAQLAVASDSRHAALAQVAQADLTATPRFERRAIALRLRSLGCTLQEIGDLFGVTREMIRQDTDPDLVPGSAAVRQSAPRPPMTSVGLVGGVVRVEVGRRVIYLTRDEAIHVGHVAAYPETVGAR
jgi:hypothetical protein